MSKIYRFSYFGHFDDGVQVVTGFHYKVVPPPAGSDPAAVDVLDGIDGHYRSTFVAVMDSRIMVDSAELREEVTPYSGEVPAAASKVVNTPGGLGGTGKVLPDALTMIVKLRTDAALRSARGYMALPGPSSTSYLSASRQWTGAYLTAVQAFAALLDDEIEFGAVTPSHGRPVVYSRTRHARQLDPYTFDVVEGVPRLTPSWRRSRTTAP